MEQMIEGAAEYYKRTQRAQIIKTPEPFRVIKKPAPGMALVRFTAHAQPDFIGCLASGRLLAFESKFTLTDRIKQDVVTKTQAEALQSYMALGGRAAVCCGIGGQYFMVPWAVFSNMKAHFGRKYVTCIDIMSYRVKFDGVIWFLDRYQSN